MRRFIALVLTSFWMGSAIAFTFPFLSQGPSLPSDIQGVRLLTAARDLAGDVWAVWEADSGTDTDLYFSRWQEGVWSTAQPVHSRPQTWDRSPSLAVTAEGAVWLAWTAADKESPAHSRLYVSRWQKGRWTAPTAVPSGNGVVDVAEPVLAAGPDGGLWLAWVGFDRERIDGIWVSLWNGAVWSTPRQVSAVDRDPALYDRQPRLAVGADGRPWLVWTGHQSGVDDEIYGSHWTGTTWTTEQMISQDDEMLDVWPTLALDAQGQPCVAWQAQVEDKERVTRSRILLSCWDADGEFWSAERIASSPLGAMVEEVHPTLAADSQRRLNLTWLVRGTVGTALAYRRGEPGYWSDPVVIQNGIIDVDSGIPVVDEGEPMLLWLSSQPGALHQVKMDNPVRPLDNWIEDQIRHAQPQGVPPIPYKYLAFGDSITWGQYPENDPQHPPFSPYPAILEDTLNVRVTAEARVVNVGEPGERTESGKIRIKEEVVDHRPTFVLIMEGTNDVSRNIPPAEGCVNLAWMIDEARKNAGVDDVKVMLATLVPRLDDKNDETAEFNQGAVLCAQQSKKHVRLCDPWQAFYNYGPWQDLYCWWDGFCDDKHPNQEGLQLLADTFYGCILSEFGTPEESAPPTAWIVSLPTQSECKGGSVSWMGQDNLTPVEQLVYDVQMNVNGGQWIEWQANTAETSGNYTGDHFGDILGFRVRARDVVGNVGEWSNAAYTTVSDSDPPQVNMGALADVQLAPFHVAWGGSDDCSDVVAYNVQYKVGAAGTWTTWQTNTSGTAGVFDPSPPRYGETYYFRAQARDEAGNWSGWSTAVQTTLAQFSLQGHIYNVRRQPIIAAQMDVIPASLATTSQPYGGFVAYLDAAGDYDLSASRTDRYGSLPTMHDVAVNDNVSGLEFILPPQDDAIDDGDFEAGDWGRWRIGGSSRPTLTTTAHTGLGAVSLGGAGGRSYLSQIVTPAITLTAPTLSLMARLESSGPVGTLTVELANRSVLSPPVTYTLSLSQAKWTHAWFDLSGLISAPLTLTLTVSDHVSILVDEVSLGSAQVGGYFIHLPHIQKMYEP